MVQKPKQKRSTAECDVCPSSPPPTETSGLAQGLSHTAGGTDTVLHRAAAQTCRLLFSLNFPWQLPDIAR